MPELVRLLVSVNGVERLFRLTPVADLRMGSCIANKPHRGRQSRKAYCYAEYSGKEARICGSRGKKRFTFTFDSEVVSARICDGVLAVKTADQWVRTCDVGSGRLVSESCPTPPAGQIGGFLPEGGRMMSQTVEVLAKPVDAVSSPRQNKEKSPHF